jgi:hypothetical protein
MAVDLGPAPSLKKRNKNLLFVQLERLQTCYSLEKRRVSDASMGE